MIPALQSGLSFIRKAVLVFGVFFAIVAVFVYFINKDRPVGNSQITLQKQQASLYSIFGDERFKKDRAGKITLIGYRFIACSFVGELCTDHPVSGNEYFSSSLLGRVSSLMALPLINPPASAQYWATDTLQKAGFIPQSYAAEGVGFASIKPLMNLWKIFRDVAYLLIVLVLVTIGFMIMFRMKINPQTVISVENALPKIVISLLLITFSFAIAGFLIDVMYLTIVLIIGILSNNNAYYDATKMQNTFLNSNIQTLWDYIIPVQFKEAFNIAGVSIPQLGMMPRFALVGDAIMSMMPQVIDTVLRTIVGAALPIIFTSHLINVASNGGAVNFLNGINLFGTGVGNTPSGPIGALLSVIFYMFGIALVVNGFGFIVGIIVMISITALMFNLFFLMFQAYLKVTLSIVMAPIILLAEAIPGKSVFSFWLKGLIGELITFPLIITILLIGQIMLNTLSYPGDYWTPPFIGSLSSTGFGVIFGMGLILIIPDILKFAKEAIGAKPLPFNVGISTFLGGAGSAVGGGVGLLGQFSSVNLGLQALGVTGNTGFMGMGKKQAAETADQLRARLAAMNEGKVDAK